MKTILIIFLFLHGIIYLLYAGQAIRLFELRPGFSWPDRSWVFSNFPGIKMTRYLASLFCLLIMLGFTAGSLAILLRWIWWKDAVVYCASISSLIFILLWNGKMKRLDDQGGIGILINLAIIISLSFFNWPDFGFLL